MKASEYGHNAKIHLSTFVSYSFIYDTFQQEIKEHKSASINENVAQ